MEKRPPTVLQSPRGCATRLVTQVVCEANLPEVNRVISEALHSWGMSPRVYRLTLPSFLYSEEDVRHMQLVMTGDDSGALGIAAWEEEVGSALMDRPLDILLHGLYVSPQWQRHGIGSNLLRVAMRRARHLGFRGITLTAWRDAEPFFIAKGFHPVDINQSTSHTYPKRLSIAL
jgi:GNAT superfamily N-acetyltransferase